jgi:hypothetical protein
MSITRTGRIGVIIAALAVTAVLAQERQAGGIGLTVFADPGYRGESATLREDVTNFQFIDLNDKISSLRVASNEVWEVCEHANFLGRCQVFSGWESDLRRIGWNDSVSSARRIRGGGRGRGRGPQPPSSGSSLEIFADVGFRGERRVFSDEVSNLQFVDFNDRARSLRIQGSGSWQICVDANFQNCIVVSASSSDLERMGMARRISSVRPSRQSK